MLSRLRPAHGLLAMGLLLLAFVLLAPALAPFPPAEGSMDILVDPGAGHLLGTDQFGRDVFSRFLAGGRSVALMAGAAGVLAVCLGCAIGVTAGYLGGWVDAVLMRCVDVQLSMPPKLLVLVFATSLPRNSAVLAALVGLLMAPGTARVVRGLTQSIAVQDFVAAAEVAGGRFLSVALHEIVPNILPRLTLELALRTGFAVLILAGLNFLGIGLSPPSPDWGLAINEGRSTFMIAPAICLAPAAGIVLLVSAVTMVTHALGELWR